MEEIKERIKEIINNMNDQDLDDFVLEEINKKHNLYIEGEYGPI